MTQNEADDDERRTLMSKLSYLARSTAHHWAPARNACPNCGSLASTLVQRKFAVTALRRCDECLLMFRTPTDTPQESETFYNEDYTQGFTTEVPSADELRRLKDTNFAGTTRDYSEYIGVLRQLHVPTGARLFDFGCSWGYGSYQLARAGYEVRSFEISRPRRAYAHTHLGVNVIPDWAAFAEGDGRGWADVFFSAHVLEHVPSPSQVIASARKMLKPGGLFVMFAPNGMAMARASDPVGWNHHWGEVHPNFIDDRFLAREFAFDSYLIASSPVAISADDVAHLSGAGGRIIPPASGSELFIAARVA